VASLTFFPRIYLDFFCSSLTNHFINSVSIISFFFNNSNPFCKPLSATLAFVLRFNFRSDTNTNSSRYHHFGGGSLKMEQLYYLLAQFSPDKGRIFEILANIKKQNLGEELNLPA
jgi:hypothetical protein